MCVLWGRIWDRQESRWCPEVSRLPSLSDALMGTEPVLGWGGVCPYRLQSARHVHVTFQSVVLGTLGRRPSVFRDVSSHSHL